MKIKMKTQKTNAFQKLAVLATLILSLLFQLNTNAQEGAYWMGLATKNPALIGTQSDWVWGIAEFADVPDYDEGYGTFALFSDYRISPKAGSVGANFMRTSVGDEAAYLAELAYAYTLSIKKSREWNFGVSAGIEGIESDFSDYKQILYNNNNNNNPKANYFKTNIGALYHSRKLDLGLSCAFFYELKNEYSTNSIEDNYVTFITAYRFYVKEKFVIEPNLRMDFGGGNNLAYGGIHLEYDNLVWLGYDTAGTEGMRSVMTGADVSKRYRLALKYSFSDEYQYGRISFYQITLGYRLK